MFTVALFSYSYTWNLLILFCCLYCFNSIFPYGCKMATTTDHYALTWHYHKQDAGLLAPKNLSLYILLLFQGWKILPEALSRIFLKSFQLEQCHVPSSGHWQMEWITIIDLDLWSCFLAAREDNLEAFRTYFHLCPTCTDSDLIALGWCLCICKILPWLGSNMIHSLELLYNKQNQSSVQGRR